MGLNYHITVEKVLSGLQVYHTLFYEICTIYLSEAHSEGGERGVSIKVGLGEGGAYWNNNPDYYFSGILSPCCFLWESAFIFKCEQVCEDGEGNFIFTVLDFGFDIHWNEMFNGAACIFILFRFGTVTLSILEYI